MGYVIHMVYIYLYMGYNVDITQNVMISHHFVYQNGLEFGYTSYFQADPINGEYKGMII